MSARTVIAEMYRSQPLVFGHRGAKAYAPMNTLPAFELALRQGAHGIELDVHRCRDGHPVVIHDFTVDATTDGTGLVSALSLADLRALDAGSWFGPQFAGVWVPTLDEVFEAVGRQLLVNVEIKAEGEDTDGVEEVVAACIRRHMMAERVVVSSFNVPTLRRFRRLMPEVSIGYLYAQAEPAPLEAAAFEAYHPHLSVVSPELVDVARSTGKVINVWTVNDRAQIIAQAQLGVHGIITDVPDVALAALQQS